MSDPGAPVLSVVAVIVSDTIRPRADARHLENCLAGLMAQINPPSMEIIVPHYPGVAGLDAVKAMFPRVRFVAIEDLKTYTGEGGSREHHDELRARGLALARGEIVAMVEDHGVPHPGWAAAVVEAHRSEFAAIGGPMENRVDRVLNWAVYFCDFGKYQGPLPEGESYRASDANVSYKRAAIEAIRTVWQASYRETEIHGALLAHGFKLGLSPKVVVFQQRAVSLGDAFKERYVWARSYARTRAARVSVGKRLFLAAFSPALPPLMVTRMLLTVLQKGRHRGAFLKALPLIALLSAGWAAGEFAGYVARPEPAGKRSLAAAGSR